MKRDGRAGAEPEPGVCIVHQCYYACQPKDRLGAIQLSEFERAGWKRASQGGTGDAVKRVGVVLLDAVDHVVQIALPR